MTALITGACGFVARFLVDRLQQSDCRILGVDQWPQCPLHNVEFTQVDILDSASLASLISAADVSHVFHLAAVSYLPDADATPRRAIEANIVGTTSVLDALMNASPSARLLLVGSSKEYGSNVGSVALPEETPANPTDFYGISKFSGEMIGKQYHRQFGLDVRLARSFNHTGPGQSPKFVCSEWARRIAQIELGLAEPVLQVGDLSHEVDFLDVRDVVDAYVRILEKGKAGEVYNVCSGEAVALSHLLESLCGKTRKKIRVESSANKLRAHKASPRLAGDNSKLREHTGWGRRIPLQTTLDDLFDYWVRHLSGEDTPAFPR